ncbi:MAG: hypothetical protein GF331_10085 [Chitinivibrionales bacterium]|nr:hypothetical protein [Chitinivibrionales bacterium]
MKSGSCTVVLFLLLSCTLGDFELVGTDTDTDTGEITGVVVGPNSLPVCDVPVILRNADSLLWLALPEAGSPADSVRRKDTVHTDSAGRFSFTDKTAGKYWLEVRTADAMGAVAEADIQYDLAIDTVDTMVVDTLGSLRGTVSAAVSDSVITWAVVLELARAVRVDSTSRFAIDSLPPGEYTVVLVADTQGTLTSGEPVEVEVVRGDTSYVPDIATTAFSRDSAAVLHLTFEDTLGILDESASNFTIQQVGTPEPVAAPFGQGLRFDGTQEYLEIPEWSFPGAYRRHEFHVLLKIDTIINDGTANGDAMCEIVNDAHWDQGRRGFAVRVTNRRVQLVLGTAPSTWLYATDSAHTFSFKKWHTVRAIIDLDEPAIYIGLDDYPLIRTQIPGGSAYNPSLLGYVRIGALAQGPARFVDGVIDEIRVTAGP